MKKRPQNFALAVRTAQGGCWWDYIQCLKMRKRKRKKRKKRKKKIRKKGGRRELNLK